MGTFKRLACAAVIVCLCAVAVQGQTLAGGSITTNGQSVTSGWGRQELVGASIQITGTWTGTITFQATVDGDTYVTLFGTNVTTGAGASSTTANGVWAVSNSGYRGIRATATAAMTGTAVVTIGQGYAAGGGGGASGSVTQGTDPWLVGGTGATYLGKAEDAPHTTADTGVAMLGIRSDTTPATTATAAGDYAVPNLDANGRMYVNATLYSAAGAAVSVATDATHDSAASSTGPQIMGSGKNTTLPTAVTDGDAVRLLTDLYGRLQPKNICENPELVSSVVISTATSGNVELVPISGSTVVTVCGFNVVATGTVAVQMISGTGTACATGETNKTGAMPFVANGGINTGFGDKIFAGAAGEAVCIELSAAIQVDGVLTYVQQ